jgi:hypothetical protein
VVDLDEQGSARTAKRSSKMAVVRSPLVRTSPTKGPPLPAVQQTVAELGTGHSLGQ